MLDKNDILVKLYQTILQEKSQNGILSALVMLLIMFAKKQKMTSKQIQTFVQLSWNEANTPLAALDLLVNKPTN